MITLLEKLFKNEKIEYFGILSIKDCKIINRSLFERKTQFAKSIISFLIPYYVGGSKDNNISLYAVSKDYHIYINELTDRIIGELKKEYPKEEFYGMGDHSPIDEVNACAKLGLGVIGNNRCLINKKYGSYIFIGEIFTSLDTDNSAGEIKHCPNCGKCRTACPSKDNCLSELTQQKGELDPSSVELMRRYNTAWGCDICQSVCPLNKNAEPTPIDFFHKDRIEVLTKETLDSMSDEELSNRAFGWRKRKTIERNINILFQ